MHLKIPRPPPPIQTHHAGLLDGLAGPDADLRLVGVRGREDHQALGVAHLHHQEDSEQGHSDDDIEDPQKFGTYSAQHLHVVGVVEMEEVAVELGLLPLVGLDAGVLGLQLQRQEQVGVLTWGQVADLHAGKMLFQSQFEWTDQERK